ncbi:putative helicase domain protein [Escherichia coli DEC6E]|nr:putative helicase domain protein [Escherichia coli DEC6E]
MILWIPRIQCCYRMWDKRQRGYKAMGYRIVADGEGLSF